MPKVVTHSGGFHADDLFAVATLGLLLGEIEIIRSRDKEDIDKADYVVDVGGEYNPEKNRFDHHQAGGAEERDNGIPYASFGLVWKKYGEELSGGKEEAKEIDMRLVQPIDAADNGHEIYTLTGETQPYTIHKVFGIFRPTWKEDKSYDDLFKELVPLAQKILKREIELAGSSVEADKEIQKIYEDADNKEIIIFPKEKDYGRELIWATLCKYPDTRFAISYKSDKDSWQTLAMIEEVGSFELRKPIPLEWGGLRSTEELKDLTGLNNVIFIHANGFMALSKDKETAIELAKKSLER